VFTPRPLYPQEKSPRYLSFGRFDGSVLCGDMNWIGLVQDAVQ
jgi:hypothetical protein